MEMESESQTYLINHQVNAHGKFTHDFDVHNHDNVHDFDEGNHNNGNGNGSGKHNGIIDNGKYMSAIPKFKIKSRLQNGEILYAMSCLSFSPTMVEIAAFAGYDVAIVDLEHGFGGISEALSCIHALKAADVPVIIRVPELSHVWVKKVLDLGPQGLSFPLIDGPESAKKAVSYCWYPPYGVRGVATPIVRASRFGFDNEYATKYRKDMLILCQVETEEAVNNVEAIAGAEGVDGIMVGPLDLSASVGCMSEPNNEKVKEMMRKIEKTVLNLKRKEGGGPYLCGFAMAHDGPENFRNRGYQLIRGATDVSLFKNACAEDVKKFKMNNKKNGRMDWHSC